MLNDPIWFEIYLGAASQREAEGFTPPIGFSPSQPIRRQAYRKREAWRRLPRNSEAGALDESGMVDGRLRSSKLHTSAELYDANKQF
jgi:glycine/D-amino acid oxidase-like deaminating enzyme